MNIFYIIGVVVVVIVVAGYLGVQSRSRKSAQSAKWSFCLTAGKIGPRIRRDNEQTIAPDARTGL